jgi:anaphase-promoting complex subunit 10
MDIKQDESYTPKGNSLNLINKQEISIRYGTDTRDLELIQTQVFENPKGWENIYFNNNNNNSNDVKNNYLISNFIQLTIDKNHENGKDTHIRQIK